MGNKFDRFEEHPRRKRLTATLTRPANATAYAAGDIIANSDTAPTVNVLAGAALSNGRGGKINALILIDSSNPVTPGDFELWLLNAAHTATNDNAAWAPSDAEAETVEAIISLPGSGSIAGNAGSAAAGNRIYQIKDINKDFRCAAASKNLWWVLIARNAHAAVSGEKFTLKLDIEQR
jgi:hypothetical protein